MKVERLLLAVDHSAGSEAIVDTAVAVARGAAALTVLHVYERPDQLVGLVPGATAADDLAGERDGAHALLDRVRDRAHAGGAKRVDVVLEPAGRPATAILEHARAGRYDLIVMGTHGRKGVARLLLGSTAEQVLRDAPCPVLVVHLPP